MYGKNFQTCWHIIKHDLLKVVQAFFCGHNIPKYFSHACLFLLLKVDHPNKFQNTDP